MTEKEKRAVPHGEEVKQKSWAWFGNHVMILKKDGTLWAIGSNEYGQLGDGTNIDSNKLKYIMDDVSRVQVGANHTMVVTNDGQLWAFGRNNYGQLGIGNRVDHNKPVKVEFPFQIKSLSTAGDYNLFIVDNNLWGFGRNDQGQLCSEIGTDRLTPVKIMTRVKDASAGLFYFVIRRKNNLWDVIEHGEYEETVFV